MKKNDEKFLVIGAREEIYKHNVRFFFDENDQKRQLTRRILVRHGETGIEEYGERAQKDKEEYSIGNIGLNEKGKKDAIQISKDLKNIIGLKKKCGSDVFSIIGIYNTKMVTKIYH